MRKQLVLATRNKGKVREIVKILGDGFEVLSLDDIGYVGEVEEDGETFEANAVKKATEVGRFCGKMTIADDSGIEIDYFNGGPGVYSARYLGTDTPYTEKNQIILDKLKEAKVNERGAKYVCVMALYMPVDTNTGCTHEGIITERGEFCGVIAEASSGAGGFGYDPIFYIPEYGMTVAEMDPELKNRISHRGKAMELIKQRLNELK